MKPRKKNYWNIVETKRNRKEIFRNTQYLVDKNQNSSKTEEINKADAQGEGTNMSANLKKKTKNEKNRWRSL